MTLQGLLQQGGGERPRHAKPPRSRGDIEAAHPLACGIGRFGREGADAHEVAVVKRREDRREGRGLAQFDLQACEVAMPLGLGVGHQGVEALGRFALEADQLDHGRADHPGLIIFSGRTHSSNSSFVR